MTSLFYSLQEKSSAVEHGIAFSPPLFFLTLLFLSEVYNCSLSTFMSISSQQKHRIGLTFFQSLFLWGLSLSHLFFLVFLSWSFTHSDFLSHSLCQYHFSLFFSLSTTSLMIFFHWFLFLFKYYQFIFISWFCIATCSLSIFLGPTTASFSDLKVEKKTKKKKNRKRKGKQKQNQNKQTKWWTSSPCLVICHCLCLLCRHYFMSH